MNLLHQRFGGSILSVLAHAAEGRARFARLLADRPTGVVIRCRVHPRVLQDAYRKRLAQGGGVAAALMAAFFLFYPEHVPTVGDRQPRSHVINVEQIPETSQRMMTASPPRPAEPLAVEGELVPDDVTIESTDLDLDRVPADLRLSGPVGPVGPVSDEPMDISEIDYKPHLLTLIMPAFPDAAKKEDIKRGVARVKLLVDKLGNVDEVEFIDGPEVFRQEAVETARRYRFRPGRHQGEARKVWMVVSIEFRNN
jgi:protein TonB